MEQDAQVELNAKAKLQLATRVQRFLLPVILYYDDDPIVQAPIIGR